jgi:cell division protease FtsH
MISPSALVRWSTAGDRIERRARHGAAHPAEPEERRRSAHHEAGHAIIGMLTSDADPVRKVSIIPRHRAGGHALGPRDRRCSHDRPYLLGNLKVALGGRVAEEHVLDDITTGAQNDIKQATSLASLTVGAANPVRYSL